jgi:hypothetical protein
MRYTNSFFKIFEDGTIFCFTLILLLISPVIMHGQHFAQVYNLGNSSSGISIAPSNSDSYLVVLGQYNGSFNSSYDNGFFFLKLKQDGTVDTCHGVPNIYDLKINYMTNSCSIVGTAYHGANSEWDVLTDTAGYPSTVSNVFGLHDTYNEYGTYRVGNVFVGQSSFIDDTFRIYLDDGSDYCYVINRTQNSEATCLSICPGGDYLVSGYLGLRSYFIMRINYTNHKVKWCKTLSQQIMSIIVPNQDTSHVIICGNVNVSGNWNGYVAKLNVDNGSSTWAYYYGAYGVNNYANTIIEKSTTGYLFCGNITVSGHKAMFITSINNAGAITWNKYISSSINGSAVNAEAQDICLFSGHDLAVVGTTANFTYVARIDSAMGDSLCIENSYSDYTKSNLSISLTNYTSIYLQTHSGSAAHTILNSYVEDSYQEPCDFNSRIGEFTNSGSSSGYGFDVNVQGCPCIGRNISVPPVGH